jgi:hypothetical protein
MIIIDLYLVVLQMIAPVQRYDWWIDYHNAAVKPLNQLLQDFYDFFNEKKYELSFNGQVIYMEHVLNDQFDPVDRGIYITDSTLLDARFIFTKAEENEETYLKTAAEGGTPFYINTASEYYDDVDFIVNIPSTVTFDLDQLKYWVNKYRIAPMRWEINII